MAPGRALNPGRYFIVVPNTLGNGLSSSPSTTAAPFDGPSFPSVSVLDNVRCQHRLFTEHLGIDHLRLVVGFSMGAQQAFHWGALYPTSWMPSRRSVVRPGPPRKMRCYSRGQGQLLRRRSISRMAATPSHPRELSTRSLGYMPAWSRARTSIGTNSTRSSALDLQRRPWNSSKGSSAKGTPTIFSRVCGLGSTQISAPTKCIRGSQRGAGKHYGTRHRDALSAGPPLSFFGRPESGADNAQRGTADDRLELGSHCGPRGQLAR
jgi:pimeloyl-ACP methyl ester carboxylesterase